MSKTDEHFNSATDPTIANVIEQVVAAVQWQGVPAAAAMQAAMAAIDTSHRAALKLLLYTAQREAEVVQHLLSGSDGRPPLIAEAGNLLLGAVALGAKVVGLFATTLSDSVRAASAQSQSEPQSPPHSEPHPKSEPAAAAVTAQPTSPSPEPPALDTILQVIADGYSTSSGAAVAQTVRERYPAAIPTMQRYLTMDDFLVLMWLRQQPAIARVVEDKGFPQFYADLKSGFQQPCATSAID